MIVPIRRMGDPCLLMPSTPIAENEFNSVELLELIQNLRDTQQHLGGVGIAAPQIGINKRVVLIEYYQKDIVRYADVGDCPLKIIINPEVIPLESKIVSFNEGCLSLPGLRGVVNRPAKIAYKYFDQFGVEHRGEDDRFFARVMQHECDHLDGILYHLRMDDLRTLSFIDLDS